MKETDRLLLRALERRQQDCVRSAVELDCTRHERRTAASFRPRLPPRLRFLILLPPWPAALALILSIAFAVLSVFLVERLTTTAVPLTIA
jgi:hypothetical protein